MNTLIWRTDCIGGYHIIGEMEA